MKILTIMTTPFNMSGITNVVLNNYKHLNKEKYVMDFVFPNTPDLKYLNYFKNNHSKVHIIPQRNRRLINYYTKLNSIMKNDDYDIVHVHGNSTTLSLELALASNHKIPVRIPHAHSALTNYPIVNKILRPLFNRTFTDGLAVSGKAGDWLYQDLNYSIVENGIEVERFKFDKSIRTEMREKLGISSTEKVIGNLGRFSKEKNQEYLIYLLKELLKEDSAYRLLLVGEGKLEKSCKELAKELKIEEYVIFAGGTTDVTPFMMAMDVLVVPSLSEGLGLTLIEGQAADLKCFASTNVPKEVNISKKVDFFSLEEIEQLKQLIIQYFSQPFTRENHDQYDMVENSNYNISVSVKILEKYYESFLSKETLEADK